MFMKSYTAIIQNGSDIRAVNMMVAPGDENESILEESYPEYNLVALVPGQHAKWSHVFASDEKTIAPRKVYSTSGSSKTVDVWNTEDILSN